MAKFGLLDQQIQDAYWKFWIFWPFTIYRRLFVDFLSHLFIVYASYQTIQPIITISEQATCCNNNIILSYFWQHLMVSSFMVLCGRKKQDSLCGIAFRQAQHFFSSNVEPINATLSVTITILRMLNIDSFLSYIWHF